MKTKEEIKNWLLDNAVNEYGHIDLSDLDFGYRHAIFSRVKANKIFNENQEATKIHNSYQGATNIYNDFQKATNIYNDFQKATEINNNYQQAEEITKEEYEKGQSPKDK